MKTPLELAIEKLRISPKGYTSSIALGQLRAFNKAIDAALEAIAAQMGESE